MEILDYIVLYFITLFALLIVDLIWLGKIAPKLYRKYIGHLMADKPNKPAALIFYTTFIVGLLIFVLVPAVNAESWSRALGFGALYGFFTYATFDITAQAVLKKWPTAITVIDLIWGSFLSAMVCLLSYTVFQSVM